MRPAHSALVADSPWRGEVSLVEPTGADTYVAVKTAAGLRTVRVSSQSTAKPGDYVCLTVAKDSYGAINLASPARGDRLPLTQFGV